MPAPAPHRAELAHLANVRYWPTNWPDLTFAQRRMIAALRNKTPQAFLAAMSDDGIARIVILRAYGNPVHGAREYALTRDGRLIACKPGEPYNPKDETPND